MLGISVFVVAIMMSDCRYCVLIAFHFIDDLLVQHTFPMQILKLMPIVKLKMCARRAFLA